MPRVVDSYRQNLIFASLIMRCFFLGSMCFQCVKNVCCTVLQSAPGSCQYRYHPKITQAADLSTCQRNHKIITRGFGRVVAPNLNCRKTSCQPAFASNGLSGLLRGIGPQDPLYIHVRMYSTILKGFALNPGSGCSTADRDFTVTGP